MEGADTARFRIGQIVEHQLFGYRGVVFDVDATFSGTEQWYRTVAKSRPPRDRPWYHVLVDGSEATTYVAERHLTEDVSNRSVSHPLVDSLFARFADGRYTPRRLDS